MHIRSVIATIGLFVATGAVAEADGAGRLSISVDVPEVTLQPASGGRKFIRLPSLEYSFTLRAWCHGSSAPESISLSVADTRKAIPWSQFDEGEKAEIALTVPARQIAPLPLDGFCSAALNDVQPAERNSDRVTVSAALSAQASVLCEDEAGQDITYVSKALDVTLLCEVPEPAPLYEID